MRFRKDTKGSSPCLTAIDLVLIAAIILCIGFFLFNITAKLRLLDRDYEAEKAALNQQIAEAENQLLTAEQKNTDYQNTLQQLLTQLDALQSEGSNLQAQKAQAEALLETQTDRLHFLQNLETETNTVYDMYGDACRALEDAVLAGAAPYRICYLTFDDGPSYSTPKFLDKLDALDVKATFFTIGVEMPEHSYDLRDECLAREAASGHAIANHTYTHAYNGSIYKSAKNFLDAVEQQDALVYSITGLHTKVVRFPAGSYYCPQRQETIDLLHEAGYTFVDWNSSAFDSGSNGYSVEYTASSVIKQVRELPISVVLMHDWVNTTLASLDIIVPTLKDEGCIFLPLFPQSSMMETAEP